MAAIEVYEAMRTLRAVRRLRPDPIPDDALRRVLEAATWAPTGGNRQAWRVVAVKDPARKHRRVAPIISRKPTSLHHHSPTRCS
jgi:nitroreductase